MCAHTYSSLEVDGGCSVGMRVGVRRRRGSYRGSYRPVRGGELCKSHYAIISCLNIANDVPMI